MPAVQVLDGAFDEPEKVSPKPLVMTLLAFIVSSTLAIAWIVVGILKT